MWYYREHDKVIMCLKIIPNASQNKFKDIWNHFLKVQIKAVPKDGAANRELIKFLAKTFQLKKQQIKICSGETAQTKKVSLPLTEIVETFIKTR